MRAGTRHSSIRSYCIGIITLAALSAIPVTAQAQTTVTLTILNEEDAAGNIVLSKGTAVEVDFDITMGPSSKNDELQLIRVDDNTVVSKKKRGTSTTGTVNLHTNAANAIAELRIDYVHAGTPVATTPTAPIQLIVVADDGSVVLAEQIVELQTQLNTIDIVQGAQIGVNTTGIATNATNIGTNTAKGATNMGAIGTNVTNIAGNTAGVTGNSTNIATNTTNIGTNTGDISALDTRVTTNEGDIAALQATPLGTLPADVAQNTADISTLTGVVGGNLTDIGNLQGDVSTNTTNITALQGNALTGITDGFPANNSALGVGAMELNTGEGNTAMVFNALRKNEADSNTAMGNAALRGNTTGSQNTALGEDAMAFNDTGFSNTAVGFRALTANTTGGFNTGVGVFALNRNNTSCGSVAVGFQALSVNKVGENTALGSQALSKSQTGGGNTAIGAAALLNNISGGQNIAIGRSAGLNQTTGSDNVYIQNAGVDGESGTIRIGTDGVGNARQQKPFIAGIRDKSTGVADAIAVVIDSLGQLGTVSSSRRYKEDIHDMAEASSGLLQLRPVTFRYKQASADGFKPQQYGLIAEEVAEVYPDLVVYNADGKVEAVQYRKLTTMLLNELQKEYRKNLALEQKVKVQEQRLDEFNTRLTVVHTQYQQLQNLTARLAKLEAQASAVPVSLH